MGSRHGDSFWDEEKSNIGLKLMQGMGWKMGAGLGRAGLGSTSIIKIKHRKGMEGIGSEKDPGRDDMWTAATSAYNDLLKRLASGGEAISTPVTTAATIQQHKSRQQLYSRFKKSNRAYSEKDREQIFGRQDASFPTFFGMAMKAVIDSDHVEVDDKKVPSEEPCIKKSKKSKTEHREEPAVKKSKMSKKKQSEEPTVKKSKMLKKEQSEELAVKKSKKSKKGSGEDKKKRKRDDDSSSKSKMKETTTAKKKRKSDEEKNSKKSKKNVSTLKKKEKGRK